MKNNNYVLAMYDIRGKQDFIFRTNRMKEIIGGSAIIRDCFDDYFYPAAKEYGKGIKNDSSEPFKAEQFENNISQGYIGELVYDGGGNLIVLFKDESTYKEVTYKFTKEVMEKIGTLRVLSSCIVGVDFDNYKSDSKKLYEVHRINESSESNTAPWGTLPIVQVDRRTAMPLVGIKDGEKVSKESLAKLSKYDDERKKSNGTKKLDSLVEKKGEESLLAIVYIDGNNMGAQVANRTEHFSTYDDCVAQLRDFSKDIQDKYIDKRIDDIKSYLKEKGNEWRLVLGAGDEVNFICNARDAFNLAKIYLQNLPDGCSSCAGIAIFHSHAPYSDVYRIAEECCESGKTLMKKKKIDKGCFIDYHYCQGAIDVSLEQIREKENNEYLSRPWFIPNASTEGDAIVNEIIKKEDITTLIEVEDMVSFLNILGRSNVKGLASLAKSDMEALKLDLKRIYAHMSENDRAKLDKFEIKIDKLTEKQRMLIYDIVISYDLWFKEEH